MNPKLKLASVLLTAIGATLLLHGCSDSPVDRHLPPDGGYTIGSVQAVSVGSQSAVISGPPGAYFVSEDRKYFHLRCPCGRCSKFNALPLRPATGSNVWELSGAPDKPTLSPSIHWFETDGVTTHWHGWLRDGVFTD